MKETRITEKARRFQARTEGGWKLMAETEEAGRFQAGVEGAYRLQATEHDAVQGGQMRLQDPVN